MKIRGSVIRNVFPFRGIRLILPITLMLLIGVSFGLHAQEEVPVGTFDLDIGIYYSNRLDPLVNEEAVDILRTIAFNLRVGFDVGLTFHLTDWLGLTGEAGLYALGYTLPNIASSGAIFEVPTRIGLRFDTGIGYIQPFAGYVFSFIGGFGGVGDDIRQYVEPGLTIQLGPVGLTGSYAFELSEVVKNRNAFLTDEGIIRVGVTFELVKADF